MTDGQQRWVGRCNVSITASQNNWAPTGIGNSTSIYIDANGNYDITGIEAEAFTGGGNAGERVLWLHNDTTAQTITFKGLSGSSSAAHQFAWSGDIAIGRGESIGVKYDSTDSLWRLVATGKVPGAGGGGGTPGGSDTQIQYNNGGAFGGDPAMTFDAANDQATFTNLRVAGVLNITGDAASTVSSSPQNSWNPTGLATGGVLRVNPDTVDVTINGITAPSSPFDDGRVVLVVNVGTGGFALVFENESGSAGSAAQRVALSTARFTLRNGAACALYYDSTSSRWRLFAVASSVLQGMRVVSDGSLQGFYDQNGNEAIQIAGVASAVNHCAFVNAATGTGPTFQPGTGGDTNVDMNVTGRGTGYPKIGQNGKLRGFAGMDTANATASEGADEYRSDLDEPFYCDSSRSDKWLSYSRDTYAFGHSGDNLAASTGLRIVGLATSDGTNANYRLPYDCTIVGWSYSRTDSDSSTFEIMVNASTVKVTISTSATSGSDITGAGVNVDCSAGDLLWARVGSGASNSMNPRSLLVFIRRRAP